MEPNRYDRDHAQLILNLFQRSKFPPNSSYFFELGLSVDANFQVTDSTPPIILLNFMYGVAAYKRWKSPPSVGVLKADFTERYKPIPVPCPRALSGSFPDERDDPNDPGYLPEPEDSTEDTTAMEEAMDELNMLLMYLSGITPEEAAIRGEKRLEEEEQMAQEAGRRKVMEWMNG